MDELRRYEMYIIFQPELEDEQLESNIDRVNGFVSTNNGEIVEVVRRGKRRLAYNIDKHNQGIDVIYQVNLPSRQLEVLERQLNLFEDVIRYLLVRREDLEGEERLTVSQEELAEHVASLTAQPSEVELRAAEAEAEEAGEPLAEEVTQSEAATDVVETMTDVAAESPPAPETPIAVDEGEA